MATLKIDQNTFVPFSHSAAGHEGISSNASGTMVIKPCTQAEIDFYTLASTDPSHASFYAHMPHFFGSLTAAPNQEDIQQLLKASDNGEGVAGVPVEAVLNSNDAQTDNGLLAPGEPVAANGAAWTPSGGKKLSTGMMIAISNAAAGITRPCVMDLKLGARLWDDDAPLPKRRKLDEVSVTSTSGSLGFRVAGMKVWAGEEAQNERQEEHCEIKNGVKAYDKFYGRDLKTENVEDAFTTFLGGVEDGKLRGKYANLVRQRFVRELESMAHTLEHEESRMYSASILMIYEGDDEALEKALEFERRVADRGDEEEEDEEDDDDEDDEAEPKVHDVCLIDFAHAKFVPGAGPDENALQGVRSALKIFKSLS